jgi:hypothetical protein
VVTLLVFDVRDDSRNFVMAYRESAVGALPFELEVGTNGFINEQRGLAFRLLDELRNGQGRFELNKQMDMVLNSAEG